MEITYSPAALPGSCYFCGNGSREFYIDTGVSVEFHGAMYVCNICAGEFAKMLKYIPHEEYKQLLADNEELSKVAYDLRITVDGLEAAINGLTGAGYGINRNLVDAVNADFLEDDAVPSESVSTGEGELGEGEGTPVESSDDSDMGELRPDDAEHEPKPLFGYLGTSKGSK